MPVFIDHATYLERLKANGALRFVEPLGRYTTGRTRFLHRCRACQHEWQALPSHLMLSVPGRVKAGCPRCAATNGALAKRGRASSKRYPLAALEADLRRHGKVRLVDPAAYTSLREPTLVECLFCSATFMQAPAHGKAGRGCPSCSQRRKGVDLRVGSLASRRKAFLAAATAIHGAKFSYPKLKQEFHGSDSLITVVCQDKGHVTKKLVHNHLKNGLGTGCSRCRTSAGEDSLIDYLCSTASNLPAPLRNYKLPGSNLELDAFFEGKGLAVEYCGLYWHDSRRKPRSYHADKQRLCQKHGIKLVTVFENEWQNADYRRKTKQRLADLMAEASLKVPARKTAVAELPARESGRLVDQWHLRGKVGASVHLALMHDGEPVAIMTLGKPRFSKQAEWELLRFCSKPGVKVQGGFSKLFAHFVRKHAPASVVNYADLRWGDGNVAKTAGFVRLADSPPAEWWAKGSGQPFLSRYQVQKHRLPALLGDSFDPALSGPDNLLRAKFYRVFDCGNAVWLWRPAPSV